MHVKHTGVKFHLVPEIARNFLSDQNNIFIRPEMLLLVEETSIATSSNYVAADYNCECKTELWWYYTFMMTSLTTGRDCEACMTTAWPIKVGDWEPSAGLDRRSMSNDRSYCRYAMSLTRIISKEYI